MLRQPLALIALVAAGYAVICVLAYLFQARLVYFPERSLAATPRAAGMEFEELYLESSDGVRLHAWYVPAPDDRFTVLFCHGNAGNISHRLESIRIFHDLGLSVLIFDYRGFGQSEGRPSEAGTYNDADAAYRYLIDQKRVDPSRVIVFGRSLGAAVAIELASRVESGALIAESAFTSMADVAKRAYPILPVSLLLRIRYDCVSRIGGIKAPKLFIHSRGDELVPYELGRKLYDAAHAPKTFLGIEGDHNAGFALSGRPYIDGLRHFIEEL